MEILDRPDEKGGAGGSGGSSKSSGSGGAAQAAAGGRVAVVVGSTRPSRICPGIAEWVLMAAREDSPLRYEIVDLAEVDLPFLDEPLMAATGQYKHEHTRAWSRTISSYDGFVFVFPQYNWGYPAPLKNAVDFLYHEWSGKPATCVTYGTRGGNRGAKQFLDILPGLHMRTLEDHLELVITRADLDDDWQLKDLEATLRPYRQQTAAISAQMLNALNQPPEGSHSGRSGETAGI
jgi:NAD(P)H-dependent FMN reductase